MGAGASFSDQRSGLLRLTRRRLRRRSRAEPPDSGPSVPGHVTRAKSRLHYVLFITALIVWNRTRASTRRERQLEGIARAKAEGAPARLCAIGATVLFSSALAVRMPASSSSESEQNECPR